MKQFADCPGRGWHELGEEAWQRGQAVTVSWEQVLGEQRGQPSAIAVRRQEQRPMPCSQLAGCAVLISISHYWGLPHLPLMST